MNRTDDPGTVALGEGNGDGRPPGYGRGTTVNGGSVNKDCRFGDIDDRAEIRTDGESEAPAEVSGGGILTGSGNKGPLFFLRRGNLKNVVVVDTVCVVVVVAYKP